MPNLPIHEPWFVSSDFRYKHLGTMFFWVMLLWWHSAVMLLTFALVGGLVQDSLSGHNFAISVKTQGAELKSTHDRSNTNAVFVQVREGDSGMYRWERGIQVCTGEKGGFRYVQVRKGDSGMYRRERGIQVCKGEVWKWRETVPETRSGERLF